MTQRLSLSSEITESKLTSPRTRLRPAIGHEDGNIDHESKDIENFPPTDLGKDSKGDFEGENKSIPVQTRQVNKNVEQANYLRVNDRNSDNLKFGDTTYKKKLDKMKRVAKKHLDPTEPMFYKNVSKLFGESTDKFDTIADLQNFLVLIDDEAKKHNKDDLAKSYGLDEETLKLVERTKKAVNAYKSWKLNDRFDKEVTCDKVSERLRLLNTTTVQEEIISVLETMTIEAGFGHIRDIVRDVANHMLEVIEKDQDRENTKKELAFCLVKLLLNIVNVGVAVELVQIAMNPGKNATDQLIATAMTAETLKDVVRDGFDIVMKKSGILGKKLSRDSINELVEAIWDKSIKLHKDAIKKLHASTVITTPDDKELADYIKRVKEQMLPQELLTVEHPEDFKYVEFVARKVVELIKQKNKDMLEAKSKTSESRIIAKAIMVDEKSPYRQAIIRSMISYFTGSTLCRDYFSKSNLELGYEEAKDEKEGLPGLKLMQKKSDKSHRYFPKIINPKILILFDPKPAKKWFWFSKMHIGGKNLRGYLFDKLPNINDPKFMSVYGYTNNGEYKEKNRIRDTWRADQLIQIFLMKSVAIKPKDDEVLLPILNFKTPDEIGAAVLEIMQVNVFYRTGDYVVSNNCPAPTPLYLLTHSVDYIDLIKKPGVKEYLTPYLTKNNLVNEEFILKCITDPNVTNSNDKPRMMQALNDVLYLVSQLGFGFDEMYLTSLYEKFKEYIDLQCDFNHEATRVQRLEDKGKKVIDHFKMRVQNKDEMQAKEKGGLLHEQLENNVDRFNQLFDYCDALEKRRDNNATKTAKLIERLVVSYLDPIDDQTALVIHQALKQVVNTISDQPQHDDAHTTINKILELAIGYLDLPKEDVEQRQQLNNILQKVFEQNLDPKEAKIDIKPKNTEIDYSAFYRTIREYHLELRLFHKFKDIQLKVLNHGHHKGNNDDPKPMGSYNPRLMSGNHAPLEIRRKGSKLHTVEQVARCTLVAAQ